MPHRGRRRRAVVIRPGLQEGTHAAMDPVLIWLAAALLCPVLAGLAMLRERARARHAEQRIRARLQALGMVGPMAMSASPPARVGRLPWPVSGCPPFGRRLPLLLVPSYADRRGEGLRA